MSATTGADIPAAIREFRAAGWTVAQIASDLGLHRSTVYRWQAGARRPNAANFEALTEAVDMQYAAENCRRRPRPLVLMHLEAAHSALRDPETDARFEARMRAKRAVILQRRALHAQRVDRLRIARQHRPVTSITASVPDAFALIPQDQEMALAEGAFA